MGSGYIIVVVVEVAVGVTVVEVDGSGEVVEDSVIVVDVQELCIGLVVVDDIEVVEGVVVDVECISLEQHSSLDLHSSSAIQPPSSAQKRVPGGLQDCT